MTRLLLVSLWLLVGCSANAADVQDAGDADLSDLGWDITADARPDDGPAPTVTVDIVLGPREEPFAPWTAGADVIVIQGPQGGVHTEHRARVTGVDGVDDLHLAIVWGEVWRDDLVLARAGWEFWDDQWEASGEGYEVELPVLIFDDRPDFGPAELRARLELKDGRAVDYSLPITLVDIP